jgi:hypothetical protein
VFSKSTCFFSVPYEVLSGEVFWSPSTESVDSVGVRPCRNVWLQSFLLLLRSFCVAVLSILLLSGICNLPLSKGSSFFLQFFCLINIGQSAMSVYALALHSNLLIVLFLLDGLYDRLYSWEVLDSFFQ